MKIRTVSYASPNAAAEFTESLKETGFAVLRDHPISIQLIDDTFNDWKHFFASEEKHGYRFDPKLQSGYFPFRTEKAKDQKVTDLKEFFHLYVWGQLPKGMNERTWTLFRNLSALSSELLGWIQDHSPPEVQARFSIPLKNMIQDSQEVLLRVIHYPPLQGGEEAEGAIRAAAHEDINLITLLPSATAPGLEVKDSQGNWLSVPCDPGQIVINSGDMLQLASGGYFVSTTHRVVNPAVDARTPRYSMPLFLHPRPEVKLSPDRTAGQYLRERLEEIGLLQSKQSPMQRIPK